MNVAEILKNCPKGTKLYSLVDGEVTLENVRNIGQYCIEVSVNDFTSTFLTKDGKLFDNRPNGECVLFPSKHQRDWSKFKVPGQKPKYQFKPFDKVLVRDYEDRVWECSFFSRIDEDGSYRCINVGWKYCIPYEGNEHLLGTKTYPK